MPKRKRGGKHKTKLSKKEHRVAKHAARPKRVVKRKIKQKKTIKATHVRRTRHIRHTRRVRKTKRVSRAAVRRTRKIIHKKRKTVRHKRIIHIRRTTHHARRKAPRRQVTVQRKPATLDDNEIEKFAISSRARIQVVGIGGSGSNTVTRMSQLRIEGAALVATNTDAAHLESTKAHRKLLLGRNTTKGLGAGSDPTIGEEAAVESTDEIKHLVAGAQLVFVNCGLGGGTGTGAAPIIAGEARAAGALTVAVVTLPFSSEGGVRMKRALQGLTRLKKKADTTIVIPNDKLLALAPHLTLEKAFDKVDDFLANVTKGITEMVTKPGMVNLDFADLKSVLTDSNYALIGMGESHVLDVNKRIEDAISETLDSPLLDVDISKAKKALVNIIGGKDLELAEAESAFRAVSSRINEGANLKWGARIDPTLPKNTLKIMVVMSGVGLAKYIEESIGQTESGMDTSDLGLEYID